MHINTFHLDGCSKSRNSDKIFIINFSTAFGLAGLDPSLRTKFPSQGLKLARQCMILKSYQAIYGNNTHALLTLLVSFGYFKTVLAKHTAFSYCIDTLLPPV